MRMSNPNKNMNETQEKEVARMSVDEALAKLSEIKEFLMKGANSEILLDRDFAIQGIRAIERIESYIRWARTTLKQKAKQNSFNKTYTSYKRSFNRSFSYKKPYSKRKFYGGGRRWRRSF